MKKELVEWARVKMEGEELLPTDDITDMLYSHLLYDQFPKSAVDSIPFHYIQETAKRIALLMCKKGFRQEV